MVRPEPSSHASGRADPARERRHELFDPSTHGPSAGASGDVTPQYVTGTTVVALTAADAVVMAADRRMSLGGQFVANKRVRKVEAVHPTGAMGIAGTVGPAQALLDDLRAETGLYAARRGEPMSVDALARTAGHLVRGRRVTPLLGAVDDVGPRVFELDGSGSVLPDDYAATGSGLQVAYGVLEGRFEPGSAVADATAAASDAVAAASERDTASGNGVTVATVTTDGVQIDEPTADGETY